LIGDRSHQLSTLSARRSALEGIPAQDEAAGVAVLRSFATVIGLAESGRSRTTVGQMWLVREPPALCCGAPPGTVRTCSNALVHWHRCDLQRSITSVNRPCAVCSRRYSKSRTTNVDSKNNTLCDRLAHKSRAIFQVFAIKAPSTPDSSTAVKSCLPRSLFHETAQPH
jgi:hypothetical protein